MVRTAGSNIYISGAEVFLEDKGPATWRKRTGEGMGRTDASQKKSHSEESMKRYNMQLR